MQIGQKHFQLKFRTPTLYCTVMPNWLWCSWHLLSHQRALLLTEWLQIRRFFFFFFLQPANLRNLGMHGGKDHIKQFSWQLKQETDQCASPYFVPTLAYPHGYPAPFSCILMKSEILQNLSRLLCDVRVHTFYASLPWWISFSPGEWKSFDVSPARYSDSAVIMYG